VRQKRAKTVGLSALSRNPTNAACRILALSVQPRYSISATNSGRTNTRFLSFFEIAGRSNHSVQQSSNFPSLCVSEAGPDCTDMTSELPFIAVSRSGQLNLCRALVAEDHETVTLNDICFRANPQFVRIDRAKAVWLVWQEVRLLDRIDCVAQSLCHRTCVRRGTNQAAGAATLLQANSEATGSAYQPKC
jgi:hypothetical protein